MVTATSRAMATAYTALRVTPSPKSLTLSSSFQQKTHFPAGIWSAPLDCCDAGNSISECIWNGRLEMRSDGGRRSRRDGQRCVNTQAAGGSAAFVAKEMERVAAKEALLFAIKDAGGLKGLSDRSTNDKAKIEVNEKILNLERLNPTPRPTTSPLLEGLWQFQWAGARSPGIIAARALLGIFPPALASIDSVTVFFLDGSAKVTGRLKVFNTVESSFTLLMKLSVEGPLRLKEDFVEFLFATPTVAEGNIPSQLKGVVDQLVAAVERLPDAVKDFVSGGLKLPLSGRVSREVLISYLDEEVVVARDKSGIPDVLFRLEAPATDVSRGVVVPEYVS